MAFEPVTINSQEEMDALFQERIARERAKFSDYDEVKKNFEDAQKENADLKEAIAKHQAEIDGFNAKLTEAENKTKTAELSATKSKIALEKGIPFELLNRLQGDTEEDLRSDADTLAKLFGKKETRGGNPFVQSEGIMSEKAEKREEYKKMLKQIKGE